MTEKPAPLAVACEMVTGAAPVLVKVSDWLLLLPTWILPNVRLAGLGASVPGITPIPVKESTALLLTASAVVAKVTLPVKVAAPVGANVIVTGAIAPGSSVSGRARLFIENPAPLMVACETMTLVPPLFERFTVLDWLDPTVIFPKTISPGPGTSRPRVTPTPVVGIETMRCPFCPLKAIVMVGSPASVGSNSTLNEAVCPAANISGKVMPVTWNSGFNP